MPYLSNLLISPYALPCFRINTHRAPHPFQLNIFSQSGTKIKMNKQKYKKYIIKFNASERCMLSFLTLPLCVNIKKNLRVCLVVRTQSHTRHDKKTAVKVKSKSLTRGLGDSILAAPVWETFSEVRYHTHDYFHFFPGNVVSCSYFTIFGKSIFSFGGISTYGGGCFNTPHISHR